MGGQTFATAADLSSLSYYSERQRIAVLSCYLLDPRRYSMQEVAEIILRDNGSQAGQRVSLITRCYGFSNRNAGRYHGVAEERDIQDFVRKYHPERMGRGLAEGTFDDFIRPRVEERKRQAQRQADAARERQQRDYDRQQEQRRRDQQAEEQRRRREQAAAEERRRQEEAYRQQLLQERRLREQRMEEARRQQQEEEYHRQEYLRQQDQLRQQAENLGREAASYWKSGASLDQVEEGIRLYLQARSIAWHKEVPTRGANYSRNPPLFRLPRSDSFLFACAFVADRAFRRREYDKALQYCQYLCDDAYGDMEATLKNKVNQGTPCKEAEGFRIRIQIYLDPKSDFYDAARGARAAYLGSLCKDPFCILHHAQCLLRGLGVKQDLYEAYHTYQDLGRFPKYARESAAGSQAAEELISRAEPKQIYDLLKEQTGQEPFPMEGHEDLSWADYQETVVDLSALWEVFKRANSTVQESGLIFKKKSYVYTGPYTERGFYYYCQWIWFLHRKELCLAREKEALHRRREQGMEQFRNGDYAGAAEALGPCGDQNDLEALKCLIQIYFEHIQDEEKLIKYADQLSALQNHGCAVLLANAYRKLEFWDKGLLQAQTVPDTAWYGQYCEQAESWAEEAGRNLSGDRFKGTTAAFVYDILNKPGIFTRLAWDLATWAGSQEERLFWLEQACKYRYQANTKDVRVKTAARKLLENDREERIGLYEWLDAQGELLDLEPLTRLYISGSWENQEPEKAAKLCVRMYRANPNFFIDKDFHLRCCWDTLAKLPSVAGCNNEEALLSRDLCQLILSDPNARERAVAQYRLAMHFGNGIAVEKDLKTALQYLQSSAEAGYPAACLKMAQFHKDRSLETALEWISKRWKDTPQCVELERDIRSKLAEGEEPEIDIESIVAPLIDFPETSNTVQGSSVPSAVSGAEMSASMDETKETPSHNRASATEITAIRVGDKNAHVKNAAQAIRYTFEYVLQYHLSCVESCVENLSSLTRDSKKNNSIFRSKVQLDLPGEPVWLGLSTGFPAKCTMVDKLSAHIERLGENVESILWFNSDGELVYSNF